MEKMDFDISHLSPKARTRLGRYFRKSHLPKIYWWIPVVAIIIGMGLAFCVDQASNHDTTALIVLGITVFAFFCGYSAWILKKEPQVYKKFREEFVNNGAFPKCFECDKDNPDKLEKCGACGADLKIKLLNESTPYGILSFDNMLQEKPVQHSASISFYSGVAFSLFYVSLSLNIWVLTFHLLMKDDTESYDKWQISYLESKADINNGMIRYLIPRPGGYSIDDSGKQLNGVPVYYKHYDKTNTGISFFGITMMEPAMTLANDHAVTYNRNMSKVIRDRDFIKQNKDSMVMLAAPCTCKQHNHNAKVLIFPKFYFDQKVIVKLSGNPDFQGTVCGIETDKTGKITYAVRIDPQTVRKDIHEDNITLIPEPPKIETPGIAAPKRKK